VCVVSGSPYGSGVRSGVLGPGNESRTRKRNERVFWFNVGYGACTFGHQAAGVAELVRSHSAMRRWGCTFHCYLHPASKHPPDTDPSINNSDKTPTGERTSHLSVDSKRSRTVSTRATPLNRKSSHRKGMPLTWPHATSSPYHGTEMKPSKQIPVILLEQQASTAHLLVIDTLPSAPVPPFSP